MVSVLWYESDWKIQVNRVFLTTQIRWLTMHRCMHRFPFQSCLNYNPLLPARGKLSTPVNSPHYTDQENVWFVEPKNNCKGDAGLRGECAFPMEKSFSYIYAQITVFNVNWNFKLSTRHHFMVKFWYFSRPLKHFKHNCDSSFFSHFPMNNLSLAPQCSFLGFKIHTILDEHVWHTKLTRMKP